jgi:hypothetical protein
MSRQRVHAHVKRGNTPAEFPAIAAGGFSDDVAVQPRRLGWERDDWEAFRESGRGGTTRWPAI